MGLTWVKEGSESFEVSKPFDMTLTYNYLNYSPLIPRIATSQLDKRYTTDIFFTRLMLRFSQPIYTFFLRCNDLNLAHTDFKEHWFKFAWEDEYFKSTDDIPKQRMTLNTEFMSLSLLERGNALITEIVAREKVTFRIN